MPIFSSVGGATFRKNAPLVIRLIRKGCTNRPFYLISVQEKIKEPCEETIEQLGSYDPFPNKFNEKLVAINFTRLEHWLKEGVTVTVPVLKLLGLCGYFPVHPDTFIEAQQRRIQIDKTIEELKAAVANLSSSEAVGSSSEASESSSTDTSESSPEAETNEIDSSETSESPSEPLDSGSPQSSEDSSKPPEEKS